MTRDASQGGVEVRARSAEAPDIAVLLELTEAKDGGGSVPPGRRPPDPVQLKPENGGIFLVAYVNGRPSGCGGYRLFAADPTGRTGEITRMYVCPTTRRSGLARSVLAELERRAIDDGYHRVVVQVGDQQRAARALYEITGYRALANSPPPGMLYGKSLITGPSPGRDGGE